MIESLRVALFPPAHRSVRSQGGYVVVKRLSRGGMGEVFLVKRRGGVEQNLALKRPRSLYADSSDGVAAFVREAARLARAQHDHIVQLIDSGWDESGPFIVMPYLGGHPLRSYIDAASRTPALVPINPLLQLAADVCSGLNHLHEQGVADGDPGLLHLDVTPDNIVVTASGSAKVIDLGLSRHIGEALPFDSACGQPAYLSPEAVRGRRLDPRSDVFSMGVVLWEMMTGRRLFARASQVDTLRAVNRAEVPCPGRLNPMIPQSVVRVIRCALNRDPAGRFPNAREMERAIRRVLHDQGVILRDRDIAVALHAFLRTQPPVARRARFESRTPSCRSSPRNVSRPPSRQVGGGPLSFV